MGTEEEKIKKEYDLTGKEFALLLKILKEGDTPLMNLTPSEIGCLGSLGGLVEIKKILGHKVACIIPSDMDKETIKILKASDFIGRKERIV